MSQLNLHVWYLVFLEVRHHTQFRYSNFFAKSSKLQLDTRHDLQKVCLVSKSFNALATPILYRSVILRTPTPSKEWRRGKSWFRFDYECKVLERDEILLNSSLLERLLDDSNVHLRRYVREVIVEKSRYSGPGNLDYFFARYGEPDLVMARLIELLPNIRALL